MALTLEHINIVKSTAPIVKEHGKTITAAFYHNMLQAHPELKNYFSLRNQQTGAQQAALANAVFAAASYIDDLPQIRAAVERIAHKHVSLFVKPEQYAVVGEFLVGAFAEVLGDALTPEIKEAWIAAYGQLAQVFIDREKQLYETAGEWQTWRKFRIAKKEAESEGLISFYLEPSDGAALPTFLPGQYVSVQIPIPELNGLYQSRQFSLSLAPSIGMVQYRITVKGGQGLDHPSVDDLASGKVTGLVSQMLHERYQVGHEVELSPPRGEFAFDASALPKETSPVVLLSAGVGATPVLSILDTILGDSEQSERPVKWIHVARHSGAVCYGKHVREAASQHSNVTTKIFLSNTRGGDEQGSDYDYKGRLDLDTLEKDQVLSFADASEYYICGPEEWMVQVRALLEARGVSRARQHLELFRTGDV